MCLTKIKLYSLMAGIFVILGSNQLQASVKLPFSLIPTTPTAMLLPVNSAVDVQYQVTNQTNITRTLTMQPMQGVTQLYSDVDDCSNPFILAPQQSCLLTLQVVGSQIPQRINGGPVVCKTLGPSNNQPDPFLCSQPESINWLSISVTTASSNQKAYVTSWIGNSIAQCDVSALDGSLQSCVNTSSASFANPEAIATDSTGSKLYVANIGNSSVSLCDIDSNIGTLNNCAITGTSGGFPGADGIAINANNSLAYVSNATGNNVSVCQIDSITGALSTDCTNTGSDFFAPSDMTLNASGTFAYISNLLSSSVTVCQIDASNGLLNCHFTLPAFNHPEGITLHPSGRFAYITNNGNNTISLCRVDALTGNLNTCATTKGQFDGFGNLAFNHAGTRAYVPRFATNRVNICSVNLITGALSHCKDAKGGGFDGPSGILLL